MKKILIVVGTRPNFIKVTRFKQVAAQRGTVDVRIVHTGQHFSANMADVFFEQFGLVPDRFLNIGAGSPNTQMAQVMLGLEAVIGEERPDLVMVVGDVNSTLAAAVTANKMGVRIGHLESGLRSFDRSMPEEHNRVLADMLTDHFFITEQSGLDNLRREGRPEEALHFVGNTMIDTLVAFEPQVQASPVLRQLGLGDGGHVLMTIHRPATVDVPERLSALLDLIADVRAAGRKVVFPIHPRTVKNIEAFGLKARADAIEGLVRTEPLDYFAFQKLVATCGFILTDSGGIQEESTYRRVPCLTLRPNTERPVTITLGSNELVPLDMDAVRAAIARIENGTFKKGAVPPLWDGHATERIIEVLERVL
ncbi:MAG: UDP-N-acetylglucosamine 2-epimerase (non-hydrolyzing) [Flavobacteriales bacterium]|nr:UDP-2,3-diacetamido-2,3-dideoxy-D-glucuronate 2-epimerase [Flavobacteriales bacterium]MCC6576453.1 UDP-N-acetylglucosamine 2-epimerase (non-hydrolyzing) [Flavobacteriales bacterium]NUQ16053.1 UDP-N-acetylglucosamine 2-epimerase (non-hydrolyzing) [Flavobacteriales bacterium]